MASYVHWLPQPERSIRVPSIPSEECLNLAKEFGTWLHVDGAYGMFGVLDSRVAELYDGVAEADFRCLGSS